MVVIPAKGQAVHGEATDSVVDRLKAARAARGLEPGSLPILRLDPTKSNHGKVLSSLGLAQEASEVIAVCSQGGDGWPTRVVKRFSSQDRPRFVVTAGMGIAYEESAAQEAEQEVEPETSASSTDLAKAVPNVGVLLIRESGQSEQVELSSIFLRELGRHWLQRYGRVRPSPYPLASYDFSDPVVKERVSKSFSDLQEASLPLVCLALFEDARPVKVLDVYSQLETPATLVRQLSGARGRHLAETIEVGEVVAETPEASPLTLSDGQENALLLGRLQESARQLWSGMDDGPGGTNKLARRALLAIVQAIDDQEDEAPPSRELIGALEDFQAEKITLKPDSELGEVLSRLRELTTTLLESR